MHISNSVKNDHCVILNYNKDQSSRIPKISERRLSCRSEGVRAMHTKMFVVKNSPQHHYITTI